MRYVIGLCAITILAIIGFRSLSPSEPGSTLDPALTFHLPLTKDDRDLIRPRRRVINYNVKISESGAEFNGHDSYLEFRSRVDLELNADDFTISAWIEIDDGRDDNVGEIISQYSEGEMRGFQFAVESRSGMTTSQSNYRNLFFGINGGDDQPTPWRDEGQPGSARNISAMAVFQGSLYVGTLDFRKSGGRVYRYRGPNDWENMNFPAASNMVATLASVGDRLCAGTHIYRWGSPLEGWGDETSEPSGRVYCYDPKSTNWEYLGVPDQKLRPSGVDESFGLPSISGFTNYRGQLYGSPGYFYGVYRLSAKSQWEYVGTPTFEDITPPEVRVISMGVWNGSLYAALNDSGGIARYDGDEKWANLGLHTLQNYSLAVYQGTLVAGTFDTGEVFKYLGDKRWESLGRLGDEDEVMALTVYNGNLYGGTLPNGEVYRYEGEKRWARLTDLGEIPLFPGTREKGYEDGFIRRVINFGVYQGRLFAGTLPDGKVFSTQVGQTVSEDFEIEPGWHQVAAVRRGNSLQLFRDGEIVDEDHGLESLNINTESPLYIGKGSGDYFRGRIRDLRIYRRALTPVELTATG